LDSQRIVAIEGRTADDVVSEQDQFRELIEAYALGSLDEQERVMLESHLTAGCADCAKALAEARWVTSQLAYLAPAAQPSDMLRARLLRTVRADAAAQPVRPSKPAVPVWLWAGIAALFLFTAYTTWDAWKLQRQVNEVKKRAAEELKLREQLQEQLAVAKREARIVMDPRSKKIMMPPHSPDMPQLEAMWHPELGLCVMGQKVPMPGKNKVLQLWLIPKTGGKPMPSQMTWPDADGKLNILVENPPEVMAETKALAISEEPLGGSLQPTSTPMWVGGVS
jgi:anti-sigma-K factor RskA